MRSISQNTTHYNFYRIIIYRINNRGDDDEEVRIKSIIFYDSATQGNDRFPTNNS